MSALAQSFDPDADLGTDPIEAGAFAIFRRFSREEDPKRLVTRWNRLPPCTRQAFEQEAVDCLDAAARAGWRP